MIMGGRVRGDTGTTTAIGIGSEDDDNDALIRIVLHARGDRLEQAQFSYQLYYR